MPDVSKEKKLHVSTAQVLSIDSTNRLVTVKYLGDDKPKRDAIIVTDPSNYSMPKPGDECLILDIGARSYYLGNIESNYGQKLSGNYIDKRSIPPKKILAKNVGSGESFLSNLASRVWVSLSNSGDFSLMNGLNDGLKYVKQNRLTRLAGSLVRLLGNNGALNIGSVMRTLPGVGETVIPEPPGSVIPAVEGLMEVALAGIRFARVHIGHVKNALGIDELSSSTGLRLRAIIQTLVGVVPSGWFQIDEGGNVEVGSTLGKVIINTPVPYASNGGVMLGNVLATDALIKGNTYTAAESVYLGSEATFLGAETTLMGSLTTYVTAVQAFGTGLATASVGSIGPDKAVWTAVGTLGTTLGTAAGTMLGAITTYTTAIANFTIASASFSSTLPSTLSLISKTM